MAKTRETKAPSSDTDRAHRRRVPHPAQTADAVLVAGPSPGPSASRLKEDRPVAEASAVRQLERADVWSQVQKLALQQLDRLVTLEPKVLRDESPKPVHDLRVASRRVQSLMDFLYAPPRPQEIQKLRRRLQRARRALGDLRNQDVMAWRTGRILARKRATHREAWEAVHAYILKLRPKTAARAHRRLTRLNLAEVYLRLRAELADEAKSAAASRVITFPEQGTTEAPPVTPAEAGPQAEKVEMTPAARFAERLGDLWQDFEGRSADSARHPSALHALRIAAKRLRYTIEVAADLEIPGSVEVLDWLRQLQGKLGDWHDADVLGQTMIEMVARRPFLEQHLTLAIDIQKLVLSLRSSKTRSCTAYLRAAFKSPGYRGTADWITQWAALGRHVG
ncbi:MAG TPA: CHAD domain-containing protein [Terriglobia bacterium]|nr:CHAD domain-containing protein [Terriglobia bacterium]